MFQTQLLYSSLEPDFSTTMMMLHEFATDIMPNGITRFPTLKYRRIVTPSSDRIDDLHIEVLPLNHSFVEYHFPVNVSANPKRQELTKYGIDEPRDLILYMALPVLEEQGLAIQVALKEYAGDTEVDVDPETQDGGPLRFLTDAGDRVFFQGNQYEVLSVYEDQFFGNTEIPMWLVAACNKWRPDTQAATLDDSDDAWRSDPDNPINSIS